ncbi:MAG: hypothetical protein AAB580_00435 [Patescibacteria group bacterium]
MMTETLSLETWTNIVFIDELIKFDGLTEDIEANLGKRMWEEKGFLILAEYLDNFPKIKNRETKTSARLLKPEVNYLKPEVGPYNFQDAMIGIWSLYLNFSEADREEFFVQVQAWLANEIAEMPELTSAKG